MTPLCMHLRSHPIVAILDARNCASTHPCVGDLIEADWDTTPALFDAVMFSQQLVIKPAVGPAYPPRASRSETLQTLQSP